MMTKTTPTATICADKDICPNDAENDADSDNICGQEDSCPVDKENDRDSDNLCDSQDSCPHDSKNDGDGDGICGDVDSCPNDYDNDRDHDLICGDVDPCPYDFRDEVDGDCDHHNLPFSPLDSLELVRKAFPPAPALTNGCSSQKAPQYNLTKIWCIQTVEVFRLDQKHTTLSGSLVITVDISWDRDQHEPQLMRYIAKVARVMPAQIHLSSESAAVKGQKMLKNGGRQSLRSVTTTITIHVDIRVDNLVFRALRCMDSTACNFNEDTTALFIASNSSATDFCTYPPACQKSTSATAVTITSSDNAVVVTDDDDDDELGDDMHYLHMGIGIGVSVCIIFILFCVAIMYAMLRCIGCRCQRQSE